VSETVQSLCRFWFEACPRAHWFRGGPAFDELLRGRFQDLIEPTASLPPPSDPLPVPEALGRVLALDQLPRNLFRGTARAFAYDAQARTLARHIRRFGLDQRMTVDQRLFAYLPFEHSEELGDQDVAVALFATLGTELMDYALAHRRIIARFGRYPHRNAALGRQSTAEELAFLAEPGSSF
jgi:uncharacterized protein (DUF924 family)